MIYDPLSWIHHRFVLACIMLLHYVVVCICISTYFVGLYNIPLQDFLRFE